MKVEEARSLPPFRRILQGLCTDPMAFGKPLYPLRHLRLQMRTCSIRPLVIEHAVSAEHRIVYLKQLRAAGLTATGCDLYNDKRVP